MKISIESLNRLVGLGLLKYQVDNKDLLIYSYTDKCQFEKLWDRHTLMARSLVVNTQGQVVCKTFEKFFNLNETETTKLENLPNEPYQITEKLDGSLIQMFNYQGEWRLTSRGSFDNEYTRFARKCLPDLSSVPVNRVYAFEVCMPNEEDGLRRAVNHEPGLYFLACFDAYGDFRELDWNVEAHNWCKLGGKLAKHYSESRIDELAKSEETGTEGWVVRFQSGLRVKIKTAWYMKLWRVIQKLDEAHIKEFMAAYHGDDHLWLQTFPEELLPEAKDIVAGIRNKLRWATEEIEAVYEREMEGVTCKKDFALKVKDHKWSWALFKKYDGKDYTEKLLEII